MSEAMQDTTLDSNGADAEAWNDDLQATHALLIEVDLIGRMGAPGIYELVLIRLAASQAAALAFAHMQMTLTGRRDDALGDYAVLTRKLGHTLWTLGATEKLIGSGAMGTLELAFRTINGRLENVPAAGSA